MSVLIKPIPFYETNYAWLLYDKKTRNAAIVDPGNFTPVFNTIKDKKLNLQSVLVTHHHSDHTGGIRQLKDKFNCQIYAPDKERNSIVDATDYVQDHEQIDLGFGFFEVISTPGHTLGSVCYYSYDLGVIFTGDTLFSLGCGRLFEGSPEQMFQSFKRIKSLPDEIMVYAAHEYTEDNGRFALTVDSNNEDLLNRLKQVQQLRSENKPSLPVMLAIEKRTNPFLMALTVEEFARLRKAKDQF
ncbi:hydroxyacylglutathione hydrolase [Commensalibacter melissae]|uniref:hydroxyacylglutathione hydrolase n=1 Tax=Commensalibacter melissae TaxID=2070537 RepID=UPI0012D9D364|nr:hydroxyacylglutathione hydrolase [Commensalibacter melissae]MUG81593.1 hydroxyacylglutathione hydrolase [Commensalibacter melissae]